MNRQEVLDIVSVFTLEQELRWLFNLGAELTISARGAYAIQDANGDIQQLMGFNELQHQIYNRTRALHKSQAWPPPDFLDILVEKSRHYTIEGAVRWAIDTSLKYMQQE